MSGTPVSPGSNLTHGEQGPAAPSASGVSAFYPFVVVRITCVRCGSYRLARLAGKFGPEISLRDLTERFSFDCLWRAEARKQARRERLRRITSRTLNSRARRTRRSRPRTEPPSCASTSKSLSLTASLASRQMRTFTPRPAADSRRLH